MDQLDELLNECRTYKALRVICCMLVDKSELNDNGDWIIDNTVFDPMKDLISFLQDHP